MDIKSAGKPATISWTTPCTFYEPTTTFPVYLYQKTADGRVKVPGILELGSLNCKNPGKITIQVPVTLPESNGYSILITIGEHLFYSDLFTIHIASTPTIPDPVIIVSTTVSVSVSTTVSVSVSTSIVTITVPGPKSRTTSTLRPTTVTTGVRTTTSGPHLSPTPLLVPDPKPKPKVNGAVLGGAIGGVVVVAIAITFVVFRRKCPGSGVSEAIIDFNPVMPSTSTTHQGTSEPDHYPSMGGARKVMAKWYEPPPMSNAHGFIAEQYEPEQYEPPPMSNAHRFTAEQYEPEQYEPSSMSNGYRFTSGQYEPPSMSNEYQGTSGQYQPSPMSNAHRFTSEQYVLPPPMSNEYQGTSEHYELPPTINNEHQGTSGQYGPPSNNQRELKVVSLHGPQIKPGSPQSEPSAGQPNSVSSPRSTYLSTPWVLTGPPLPSGPQGIVNTNPLDAYLDRSPQNDLAGTSSVVRSPLEASLELEFAVPTRYQDPQEYNWPQAEQN
ncbi:hypothetical protein BGZ89_012429 [Linnemannia elongata]|nr:hypothetical protein BGZ89_012429 [Linnemannia elongata]